MNKPKNYLSKTQKKEKLDSNKPETQTVQENIYKQIENLTFDEEEEQSRDLKITKNSYDLP